MTGEIVNLRKARKAKGARPTRTPWRPRTASASADPKAERTAAPRRRTGWPPAGSRVTVSAEEDDQP